MEWLKLGLYYKKGTSGSPSAMKSLRSLCLCMGVVYMVRRGVNEAGSEEGQGLGLGDDASVAGRFLFHIAIRACPAPIHSQTSHTNHREHGRVACILYVPSHFVTTTHT